MTKTAKRVDCFSAHGSRSEKKCDTWAKAREGNRTLTLSIPTMLILTFRILCVDKIGSPGGLGVHNYYDNNTNKDFGTRAAPERRFPTPSSFSLRNPQRRSFGKIWAGGPQTKYISRFLTRTGRRACFSGELRLRSAYPLGRWLQNRLESMECT